MNKLGHSTFRETIRPSASGCQRSRVSSRFFPRIGKYLGPMAEVNIKRNGLSSIEKRCRGTDGYPVTLRIESTERLTVRPFSRPTFSSRLSFRAISLPTMNLSAHTFGSRPFLFLLLLLLVIPLSSSASLALVKTAAGDG